MKWRRPVTLLATTVLFGTAMTAGWAQEEPEPTTSTTEPTTTSTTEAPRGPTLLPPPSTTTTTTAPPSQPPPSQADQPDEGPAEEVPTDAVVVPPDPTATVDPTAPVLTEVAQLTVAEVEQSLRSAELTRAQAAAQVGGLDQRIASLEGRLTTRERDQAGAAARLAQTREQMRKRAVSSYMTSPASPINIVLEADSFGDLTGVFEMLRAVSEADRARTDEYRAAQEAAGAEITEVVAELDSARSARLVATTVLDGADSTLLAQQIALAAVRAGQGIVGAGFAFPVGGPRSYIDSWGFARMFGTSYAHLHQGTDIFADHGTPLVAAERGVLIRVGTDTLGGTKLWLVGASGTRYYYAHMAGYAPGVTEGKAVAAGELIGFVGSTGNAAGGSAHPTSRYTQTAGRR